MNRTDAEVPDRVRYAIFCRGVVLLMTIAAIGFTSEMFCNNHFPRPLFVNLIVLGIINTDSMAPFLCTLSGSIIMEFFALLTLPDGSFDCINPVIRDAVRMICGVTIGFDIVILCATLSDYIRDLEREKENKDR